MHYIENKMALGINVEFKILLDYDAFSVQFIIQPADIFFNFPNSRLVYIICWICETYRLQFHYLTGLPHPNVGVKFLTETEFNIFIRELNKDFIFN